MNLDIKNKQEQHKIIQETWIWSLTVLLHSSVNSKFSFELSCTTFHSSTLAWRIPWTEEPGGLQYMGSWRVGHDWTTSLSLFTFMHWRRKWQPTPVLLPGESQGQGSLVGCRLWGRTESDTTEATEQQQEPGELKSIVSQKVGHDWSDLAHMQAHFSSRKDFLSGDLSLFMPCLPIQQ